jgi:sterol desaturase/sphingolipid hydroxylase (fatty acid hydroxylase superfamily)
MRHALIRYLSYPLVFGASALAFVVLTTRAAAFWPIFPILTAVALSMVALLERMQPYQREWLADHGDFAADVAHNVVNLGLLLGAVAILGALRGQLPAATSWPHAWPIWAQVLVAGAVIDLGLYAMHRASHRRRWLWRLHAPHHSPERLYWLNGERRHPLSALLLMAPGLLLVVVLGAPAPVVSCWLSILAVHLAFQHANLDYSLGPLRALVGVAEIHRWHHKREYEDAQVNFGEFWMLWDHLFGSFHDQRDGVRTGDVGLREPGFPRHYLGQLAWPFTRAGLRNAPAGPADAAPTRKSTTRSNDRARDAA